MAWDGDLLRLRGVDYTDLASKDFPTDAMRSWLDTLLQAEHLSLLVGSGLSRAVCGIAGTGAADMSAAGWDDVPLVEHIVRTAREEAVAHGLRDNQWNVEDLFRIAAEMHRGMEIVQGDQAQPLRDALNARMLAFMTSVLEQERSFDAATGQGAQDAEAILAAFLLTFGVRGGGRDRLHLFSTNYDRMIERAAEGVGLRLLDRFVGSLRPTFRSSRQEVDLHYNPPGLRGEPRPLEGVVRFSKIHGSLDWAMRGRDLVREPLPFGADPGHPSIPLDAFQATMIYPNSAKDIATTDYPYSELFRDFSAAVCRPQCVLVTYGYGFADDHINRVIADMMAVPSTHLVVIAYGDDGERVSGFVEAQPRSRDVTVMFGPQLADLTTLVADYLPRSPLDRVHGARTGGSATAAKPVPTASVTP